MRMDVRPILAALGLLLSTAAHAQTSQPASSPASPAFQSAEEVLEALERADEGLRTFTSEVTYATIPDLGGAMTTRRGRLAFAVEPSPEGGAPRRRFGIHFESRWVGTRLIDGPEAKQTIAFDGNWLVEKNYANQTIERREIVPAGRTVDPFELGDGPFPPLPIGQKREDILARYAVRLVPVHDGLEPDPDLDPQDPDDAALLTMANRLKAFTSGCTQIVLTPRGGEGDGRFSQIRLWYRPGPDGRLLPNLSRTIDTHSRNVSIVMLYHPLEINGPAAEELLSIEPPQGWPVRVYPLEEAATTGTTSTTPRGAP